MRFIAKTKIFVAISLFLIAGSFAAVANANHSWGKYHWDLSTEDTIANPLELGDNLSTANWDSALSIASTDWNASVLRNSVVSGSGSADCDPTYGRVEVCNGAYGTNGWLGIASIWATRGKSNHIVQGVVKVNDTYFNMAQYNSQAWRDFVICQEIGHTFGLDHQDENFYNTNLGSCMDYTNDPDGSLLSQLSNLHPNLHDYEMMVEMYAHLNSTDTGGTGNGNGNGKGNNGKKPSDVGAGNGNINLNDPSEWGQAVKQDAHGRNSVYERILTNGQILITHVIWAD